MTEYKTDQSPKTVSSVAIVAGIIAVEIMAGQHGIKREDLDKFLYKPNAYSASVTSPTFDRYRSVFTGEYCQKSDPSEGNILTALNPLIIQVNYWVDSVNIPQKWAEEGIRPPTLECRTLAKSVVLQLLNEQRLYPSRISATIEEGVFVNYTNHINNRNLSLEIYNDLDIAAIITWNKEIIISTDISNEDFSKVIQIFQKV